MTASQTDSQPARQTDTHTHTHTVLVAMTGLCYLRLVFCKREARLLSSTSSPEPSVIETRLIYAKDLNKSYLWLGWCYPSNTSLGT